VETGTTSASHRDSSDAATTLANREAWKQVIDELVEWGRFPERLEDEEIAAPTRAVVSKACHVAVVLRDSGWPPPLRVCTDGEGGIVFERPCRPVFQSVRIYPDSRVELITLVNSRVVARDELPIS
jgi:hypothetical protein